MKKFIYILTLMLIIPQIANAASLTGRLGIGMTNHIQSGMQAISLKLQRNRASALGGHFGIDSSSDGVFYAMGLKGYRYIYEEPQLNFYSALGGTYFTYKNETTTDSETGYQIDGTFGTEFSFQGLESIGFSFEFGMGFSQYNDETHLKTVGHNMIASAVHFYL